ncbi:MAG: 50S ribosomal protein L24 [Deltaproteobacteria bacterium]|jgi:large subunit ribosomal protein L24
MARAQIRIRKGDNVYVLSGKEKGKTGKVLEIDHQKQRAIVEKLMVFKRHYKRGRNPSAPEGGIVEKNGSIHVSNLALLDPESKKPTRIGTKLLENGKRVRIARRSGAQIDQ